MRGFQLNCWNPRMLLAEKALAEAMFSPLLGASHRCFHQLLLSSSAFDITENGLLLLAQDVVSDTLQKTLTICPTAFMHAQGHGKLNFKVNFFQDAVCNCND